MIRIPRITFGVPKLDKALDRYADEIERGANLKGVAPVIVTQGDAGPTVKLGLPREFYAKITGAGTAGVYPASEVMPGASGAWSTFPSGWSGNITEYNANNTLPTNYICHVRYYGQTNDFRFQAGSC